MEKSMIVNGEEYCVFSLLGHGKGGYSYLAERAGRRVVIKQIHHEPCDYYSFGNKIEAERHDYERLLHAGVRIPRLLALDEENERLVKEYIEGPTVLELLREGRSAEDYLPQVRDMAAQAKAAGLNIDYFPSNFVVSGGLLYYIDYECNGYMDEWSFENWGVKYWSRTPELLAHLDRISEEEKRNMAELTYLELRERPELMERAADWFHSKWGVPAEAYLACMEADLKRETEHGWYLCLDGERIVGGLGVIDNDFHERKDLSPNICAVYTEEDHRCRGIAGRLLDLAVEDLRAKGVSPVYLLTDHTGFYERYGWEFLCMVQGNDESELSRMYIHR